MAGATAEVMQSSGAASATESMRYQAGLTRYSVDVNVKGLSHADSLIQPQPAGNCANWVLGHLLAVYTKTLPMFGEQGVIGMDRLERYDRGSVPMTGTADAIPFDELLTAWNEACNRIDAGLAQMSEAVLAQPVANSPTGNPNETVKTLLYTVMFHQAYHAGQLGVLRRLVGKEGAIK